MLILPLHRPLSRGNFPLATTVLVLLNCFVFFALQDRDGEALQRAQAHYLESELGRYEIPAYERHLKESHRDDELKALHEVPEDARAAYVMEASLSDADFERRLKHGELFAEPADVEAWRSERARYDLLQSDVFTLRHFLRNSEINPWRMFASAFLHGDLMHLLGNMVFLIVLGPLVEGALGWWRYALLYALGALGASAGALAWNWGEPGSSLGASGAIASLMGAFCVLWGRNPVRFFYWFGVVFDYVRKPAIWLLPVWLGWEVFHLLASEGSGVSFESHAGGIVSGAMLGGVMVLMRQVRQEYIQDAEDTPPFDDRWERAQAHLGKMQLSEADLLLDELLREQPERFDWRLAHYRVARNAGQREKQRERGLALLSVSAPDIAGAVTQADVLAETGQSRTLPPELRLTLARRWLALRETDSVERLLFAGDSDAGPEFAQLWLELGLRRRDAGDGAGFQRVMEHIVSRFAREPQAQKARFLLENS